jgi:hypothetical protein
MSNPSIITKTNQTWKLGGGLVILFLGFAAMVYGIRHPDYGHASSVFANRCSSMSPR